MAGKKFKDKDALDPDPILESMQEGEEAPVLLVGYVGEGDDAEIVRLHPSLTKTSYVEVRRRDVVHAAAEDARGPGCSGQGAGRMTRVWVRAGAPVLHVARTTARGGIGLSGGARPLGFRDAPAVVFGEFEACQRLCESLWQPELTAAFNRLYFAVSLPPGAHGREAAIRDAVDRINEVHRELDDCRRACAKKLFASGLDGPDVLEHLGAAGGS